MTPAELVIHLAERGVRLWAEGDKLRYKAPKGTLTPDILAELAGHKAEIVALLRAAQGLLGDGTPPISTVSRRQALPLSLVQQRRFPDGSAHERGSYAYVAALRLSGQLDREALRRALAAVRRRHEILRTTFAVLDGQPVQVIAPAWPVPVASLQTLDLTALPDARREPAALALAEAARRHPFDLARGPLLRVALVRLAPREHVLLLALHRLIGDEWSLELLVDELRALYGADTGGQLIVLPVLPIQYADYAAWQRGWQRGEGDHAGSPLQTQLAYWRRQLAGAPTAPLLLPDHPRPTPAADHGAAERFTLAQPLAESLRGLGQQTGATLFEILLTAFLALLYHRSGLRDLVVGTPVANRARAETEGLIGPFANMLALRVRLDEQANYDELLSQVREVYRAAYAHQDVPFELLAEALRPGARPPAPLFQVVFAFQRAPRPAPASPDLAMELLPLPGAAPYDLTLRIAESADYLHGALEYRAALFEASTIVGLRHDFQALLERITADPQRRLDI